MIFFAKEKSTLQKLREREYANADEKQELLAQLADEFPAIDTIIWMLSDNDSALRNFAARYIKKDRSQKLLHLLIDEVKARPQLGKKYILPVIANNNFKGFFDYASKNISNPENQERILVMEILAHIHKVDPFFSIYQEAVNDPEEKVRYLAVHKLCSYIETDRNFLLLAPLTSDESERIRHLILLRMAKIQEDARVVDLFFARLPHEKQSIQEKMIECLSRLASNPELHIEERLIPELASEKPMAREVAARLLAQMRNKKEIIRKFLIYTRGIAFWLRERIFESIGTIAVSIADTVLELLQDQDQMIRLDSMFLAVYIRDQRIIPGVVDIVRSDMDWWVKSAALDILAELKAIELPTLLAQSAGDPDLQCSIISAFHKTRHPSGFDFLVKGLESKSRYIRLESFRALLEYDMPPIKAIIKKLAETSTDEALRYEARKVAEQRGIQVEAYHFSLDHSQEMQDLQQMGLVMADEHLNDALLASVTDKERSVELREAIVTPAPSPKTPLPSPAIPEARPPLSETPMPMKMPEVPRTPFAAMAAPEYPQRDMDAEATAPLASDPSPAADIGPTLSQREKLKQLYRQIQEGTLPLRSSQQQLATPGDSQNQTPPEEDGAETRPTKRMLRFKLAIPKSENDHHE